MDVECQPLGEQQSLCLLAGVPVGRMVYTVDALPAVLPVRFHLDGEGRIVVHARARSELVRAAQGALIAFETGEIDDADGSGWTVTVLGWAEVARAAEQPPGGGVLVRLRPELVVGARLAVAAEGPAC